MPIFAATDFSDDSRAAIRAAARVARSREMSLVVAHFLEDLGAGGLTNPSEAELEELTDEARRKLEQFVEETLSEDRRPPSVDCHVEAIEPPEGISTVAARQQSDLVVVGATGRNAVRELFVGSTAEEVVRTSDLPVLVVAPDEPDADYDRIVAPVDFSACSRRGLELAIEMAHRNGAALDIVHAYRLPTSQVSEFGPSTTPVEIDKIRNEHTHRLEEFVEDFELDGLSYRLHVETGDPAGTVIDTVDDTDADLVVMGTHGRRGFKKLFLGSTAAKVLRRMPCSIMTVRTRDEVD